jgi:hypothetical protein
VPGHLDEGGNAVELSMYIGGGAILIIIILILLFR